MDSALTRRAALGLGGIGAAALAVGVAGSAQAATAPPPDLGDITAAAPVPEIVGGCVGLARGQVARLSFHVRHIIGEIPPDPIDVAIRIRNLVGVVLAEQIFTNVPANHGGFVDLPHPAARPLASPLADRLQLIGEIEHTRGYTVGGTLEIIAQNTGITVADIAPCVIPAPLVDAVGGH